MVTIMMSSMVVKCFKTGLENKHDVLSVSAFVVPFGFFFLFRQRQIFLVNGTIYLCGQRWG